MVSVMGPSHPPVSGTHRVIARIGDADGLEQFHGNVLTRFRFSAVSNVVLAVLLIAGTTTAFAQNTGATLQGTITDEQGAVMPGATVVVANIETGWTRDVVTDERGWYRATALTPGNYEVRVTLQGFATQIRQGLT